MQKGRQHQRKLILTNAELFCSVVSLLFDIILFFKEWELPLPFFSILYTILLVALLFIAKDIFTFFYKEWKGYRRSVRELEESAESDEILQQKYAFKVAKYKNIFKENCKSKRIKKYWLRLIFLFVIIFIMGIANPTNAYAYLGGLKNVISGTTAENKKKEKADETADETSEKENEPENKGETAADEEGPEAEAEERNTEWRFILDEPGIVLLTDSARENQVFFYTDEPLEDSVSAMKEQWKISSKDSVTYKTIQNKDGKTFDDYTELEDDFKEDVADAAPYVNMKEWMKYAPHSSDYDVCISGREDLNQVEMNGKKGSYKVWWQLANDYLYLAQEYERQTENVEAVSYYYINSIYCCMEALQYDITKKEYDSAFSFLAMRYHDICRYECIMPSEEKERAAQIYSFLMSDDQ